MNNFSQYRGMLIGLFLFLLLLLIPLPEGMSYQARAVAAIALLMASWWISETIPLAITALLPVILFPIFDVMSVPHVTSAYGNQVIFLFLGGFIIALSIERWNLHKRIALRTIQFLGTSAPRVIMGFMIATAFLSMWISNTATALMMLPVAMAVIGRINQVQDSSTSKNSFATILMLSIAYSASIGGVATLIGTPPNAIFAGIVQQQLQVSISFFDWMIFATPLALIFLIIAWFYFVYILLDRKNNPPSLDRQVIDHEIQQMGPMSIEEKRVFVVFLLVAFSWIFRGMIDLPLLEKINDSVIAIAGAILLFLVPASAKNKRLMDWQTAKNIPWDILILFGGGFALASGFSSSGLTKWIGNELLFLQGIPTIIIVLSLSLLVIFLTEVTSNTATASLLIPIMVALSDALQMPAMYLMATVAIAASYAFMLPVATPPNAIIYSSRRVTIMQMVKAGFYLNLIGSVLITAAIMILMPLVWS